ncbi:MAG: 50S ribosomal protein L29 [candidate division WS6 bacterium OLB20]|uniref:Large ribosomal subunit protein uL29 n=1 Tax=candidate division WS6 bacterium OLB20 TaxID=1617426 RepID=A0A136LX08_9BACT|nr:MAG: 50S ribosomal protein L29 [candidate division WS6 bacterium OLB20]
MKAAELRKQTKAQLEKRLSEKQTELAETRFDVRIGQETNYSVIGKMRTEIARIKTLLNTGDYASESADKPKESAEKDGKKQAKSDKITKSSKKS